MLKPLQLPCLPLCSIIQLAELQVRLKPAIICLPRGLLHADWPQFMTTNSSMNSELFNSVWHSLISSLSHFSRWMFNILFLSTSSSSSHMKPSEKNSLIAPIYKSSLSFLLQKIKYLVLSKTTFCACSGIKDFVPLFLSLLHC